MQSGHISNLVHFRVCIVEFLLRNNLCVFSIFFCEQIIEELALGDGFDPDLAAARIIGRTWTPDAMRQRTFAVFGGDFLMKQNVEGLKGFFSGFFKLHH